MTLRGVSHRNVCFLMETIADNGLTQPQQDFITALIELQIELMFKCICGFGFFFISVNVSYENHRKLTTK